MNVQRRNSWMWAEACALLDEAERRQRHFFDLLTIPSATPAWEPPANLFFVGGEWHVQVALPGAQGGDVVVRLSATGLLVEATVPPPAFAAGVNVVRLEIPYGRMRRRIELPPGRYAVAEHRFDNGYLFLRITESGS